MRSARVEMPTDRSVNVGPWWRGWLTMLASTWSIERAERRASARPLLLSECRRICAERQPRSRNVTTPIFTLLEGPGSVHGHGDGHLHRGAIEWHVPDRAIRAADDGDRLRRVHDGRVFRLTRDRREERQERSHQ